MPPSLPLLRASARSILASLTLVATLGVASTAEAESIAYVDGNEVRVSSLDGTRKARLSAGEGDWRVVTAADNGRVLGVRLEAGKISQLARIQLWDSNGAVLSRGPLPYETSGWVSYAAPLSLDLSADGVFLAYGYAGQIGYFPNSSYHEGHNVVNADTKSLIQPIAQRGYLWPTMFGRRVIAAQGSQIVAQLAGSGPFGASFVPLVDVALTGMSLGRTDVAANGRLLAFELGQDAPAPDKIGVISIQGVDAPPTFPATVDCYIPAVGDATDVTLSRDGTRIAWKDDQGVKSAGAPTTAADPCVFSSPPILISATGSYPSIGGFDVATGPGPAGIALALPTKVTAAALARRAGVILRVTVAAAGKVTVKGTVPRSTLGLKGRSAILVTKGSASATRAGTVRVKLRLNARARKSVKRLRGAKLTLRVTQGSQRASRIVKLR